MRNSVRLYSWESFLVILSSISSETWVIYSSAISGLSVFCDLFSLVFSVVSLKTAANFLLFLNFAMTLMEKLCQLLKQNWFFLLTKVDLLYYGGREFQKKQTVNDVEF